MKPESAELDDLIEEASREVEAYRKQLHEWIAKDRGAKTLAIVETKSVQRGRPEKVAVGCPGVEAQEASHRTCRREDVVC
jgi:hypothetical protein